MRMIEDEVKENKAKSKLRLWVIKTSDKKVEIRFKQSLNELKTFLLKRQEMRRRKKREGDKERE